MLNFCSLYSGSSGNSLFVQNENTNILIDAGESAKKIVNALSSINVPIEKNDEIVFTNENLDNIIKFFPKPKEYGDVGIQIESS